MTLKKAFCVFLMAVIVSGLAFSITPFRTVQAEASIPKPSVPEFTVKFVDNSYDVPPVYGVDPYTGKNVITQGGYHVENKTIDVTIKNQPFTSYRNENGSLVGLFYNIRVKGHFEDWTGEPTSENYIYRSDSEYTVKSYTLGENGLGITAGGQVDFQVEALIGYYSRVYGTPVPPFMESYWDVFTGESSGWSETQTLTIPSSASSPADSPSPASSPNQTSEPTPKDTSQTLPTEAIIGAVTAGILMIAGLLVYFKKRSRSQTA
mgnify:CR=1 FL=1